MADRALLTVRRPVEGDIGQRQVVLTLDGDRLGVLLVGQSLTREIPAGHHRLRADNTLLRKTVDFSAEPGAHVRFATANREGFGSWLVWVLGAGPIYVALEREDALSASA